MNDTARKYNLMFSEENTEWAYVAQGEITSNSGPLHENKLRAEGMLMMAEYLTKMAETLMKGHLNS